MQYNEIPLLLKTNEKTLLSDWLNDQKSANDFSSLISDEEIAAQSAEFLKLFLAAIEHIDATDIHLDFSNELQYFLNDISKTRANQGFSPTQTATFVFSIKQALFEVLKKQVQGESLLHIIWMFTLLIDKLGLYTIEQSLKNREEIINRQQLDMLELSTPVIKVWDEILLLPLIGTLDSSRTQQVMESLLQKIVETNSRVSIIDITGIPTVDTLVAQHLIKTINAARLMGNECIISGIRPQIAQTVVQLGISLQDVITRSTLSDAIAMAMKKVNYTIQRISQ